MNWLQAPHSCAEASKVGSPLTKVAIIAPRDEHRSRTCHISIRMISKTAFKQKYFSDASATVESYPTHAHHAER